MKTKIHRWRWPLGIVLAVALLCSGMCLWILWTAGNYISPLAEFYEKEKQVSPLYDALNDTTASELPPLPDGAREVRRWSEGIVDPLYLHGRLLHINVHAVMTGAEILDYYGNALLANGWHGSELRFGDAVYVLDTACIRIETNLNEYNLVIWHDFVNQKFSPPLPDTNLMKFVELDEGGILRCP